VITAICVLPERASKPSVRFEEFPLRHSLSRVRSSSLADHSAAERRYSLVRNCVVRLRDDAVLRRGSLLDDNVDATVVAEISEMNQTT